MGGPTLPWRSSKRPRCPRWLPRRSRHATTAARMGQDASTITQDGPKTVQNGIKTAQDAPKTAQEDPQYGPKRPTQLNLLKCLKDFRILAFSGFRRFQTAPEASKMAPRRPKRASRRSKRPPRRPQDCPRGPQDGPRGTLGSCWEDGPGLLGSLGRPEDRRAEHPKIMQKPKKICAFCVWRASWGFSLGRLQAY